ncbi:hypothetical protein PGT21_010972 [Puccinia graminis f. sp. tritici]|uniref:Uncharacterized protein n=1 Tax=Puccinia graminis f. sp. tritici TaxID=56615 RepID=A0A5B0LS18_PUCGR|nr:hypothetical protein PGTUg99_028432 [Puccinia graminis f. sp. tritici]KAA1071539.1 hypothetical protein PGT21_010972 [Puccinia graminis f. sp. tritici]
MLKTPQKVTATEEPAEQPISLNSIGIIVESAMTALRAEFENSLRKYSDERCESHQRMMDKVIGLQDEVAGFDEGIKLSYRRLEGPVYRSTNNRRRRLLLLHRRARHRRGQ